MHKHEKFTKRETAIIGAAVVTTCIAGYFGYKYFSYIWAFSSVVRAGDS